METITVVVPVYKVEKYLEKCINSILSQSYKELEILLIPQPGGDECEKICRDFEKKDTRVKVLPQEYCDLSHARNVGIENAHGEYIAFVDSDDMIDADFIKYLHGKMTENDADIVQCCSYAFIDENTIASKIDYDYINVHTGKEMCYNAFGKRYGTDAGVIQTKLYKTSLFDDIRFPEGRLNEDGATNYKLYWKAKKIVVSGRKLYYYRSQRKDSITHAKVNFRLYKDSVTNARECAEFYKNVSEEGLYYNALYVLLNTMVRAAYYVKDDPAYVKDIKKEQKEVYHKIKKSNCVSRKRKLLAFIGAYFPEIWMKLWVMRGNMKRFYEWRIKGDKK